MSAICKEHIEWQCISAFVLRRAPFLRICIDGLVQMHGPEYGLPRDSPRTETPRLQSLGRIRNCTTPDSRPTACRTFRCMTALPEMSKLDYASSSNTGQ